MKLKTDKKTIFVILLFIAGLSLLLYPLVANQWNTYRQSKLLNSYDAQVAQMERSGEIDYKEQWSKADAYNQSLKPSILPDSFAVAEAEEDNKEYFSCLNLTKDGMMGSVEIPKIDIKIPVFHTTEDEVLEKAAGHLQGSSLPVGGEGTHTVISAHRGLPSASLFTDLDKLAEGDHFLLHILDETLCYQVDLITVAKPDETGALSVEEGEDLATLLTCTPYGINSHRLLVRGHRVDYVESAMEDVPKSLFGVSPHTSYLLWVITGLAVTGIVIGGLYVRERRAPAAVAAEKTTPVTKVFTLEHREYMEYADTETYTGYREYADNENDNGYREYTDNDVYDGYKEYTDNDTYAGYREYTDNDTWEDCREYNDRE